MEPIIEVDEAALETAQKFLMSGSKKQRIEDLTFACYHASSYKPTEKMPKERVYNGREIPILIDFGEDLGFTQPETGNIVQLVRRGAFSPSSSGPLLDNQGVVQSPDQPFHFGEQGLTVPGVQYVAYLLRSNRPRRDRWEDTIGTAMACIGIADKMSPTYRAIQNHIKHLYKIQ